MAVTVITHAFLVKKAGQWLCKKHPVVITEITSCAFESPDAIGFTPYAASTLIEVKVGRGDFLQDAKKRFRKIPEKGIGKLRYFAAPKGLIKPEELPANWGLLEWHGRGFRTVVKAQCQPHSIENEVAILISCLRRVGHAVEEGVSIRCYTHQTQCRASLSVSKRLAGKKSI